MVAAILTDSRARLYPLRKYLFARLADGRNKHARQVCAVELRKLAHPACYRKKGALSLASAKQKRACYGLRSALCILFAFRGGFTRPHLCLYERFRLFKSAEIIFSLRSARQVCAVELRKLAHPAC